MIDDGDLHLYYEETEMAKPLARSPRVAQHMARQAERKLETDFFIVWNPAYPEPPRARFAEYAKAEQVAKHLALRHPGEEFFVLKPVALIKSAITKPRVKKLAKA